MSTDTLVAGGDIEIIMTIDEPMSMTLSTGSDPSYEMSVGSIVERESSRDYEELNNLPSIEGTTLIGNKTTEELGISSIGNAAILALF